MAETFVFGELSAGAKEKALEAHREQLDYTWWGSIYEDAARVGGLLGIEIGLKHQTQHRSILSSPDISFFGFSSQGDGCSWSGTLWIENFEHAVAKIAEDAPNDQDLAALAVQADEIYKCVVAEYVAQKLDTSPTTVDDLTLLGYPDCYPTVKISVKGDNHRGFNTAIRSGHYDIPLKIEDDLDKFCQDFADWIYTQLEQAYEYYTSDEQTIEHINANEMMFYEDGSDV